jgi:hypothetical protein
MTSARYPSASDRNPTGAWLLAAGIGAGLMYLFDPQNGRRRRALCAIRPYTCAALPEMRAE